MQENLKTEYLEAYDAYADVIFRMCYNKTSNRDEARDMTQETFIRVWERLSTKQEPIENLRAFLFTVARNLIKDYYKKKKPILARDLPPETMEQLPVASMAVTTSETRVVLEALETLPEAYREVLQLHLVEGIPVAEVAELLGERPNTISVRLKRGIEKIRTTLHIETI